MSQMSYWTSSLLVLACASGQLALAQSPPVAPQAPRQPVAQPTAPGLGVPLVSTAPHPAHPAQPAILEPIYLLNSRIIISGGVLREVNPKDIAQLTVYKGLNVPAPLRDLADRGIIDITFKTKHKLATKSLADISRWLKLTEPVDFWLEGHLLLAGELRIATESIAGLDVARSKAGTMVNIRLTPASPTPPGMHPPGTILIRGLAGK